MSNIVSSSSSVGRMSILIENAALRETVIANIYVELARLS